MINSLRAYIDFNYKHFFYTFFSFYKICFFNDYFKSEVQFWQLSLVLELFDFKFPLISYREKCHTFETHIELPHVLEVYR